MTLSGSLTFNLITDTLTGIDGQLFKYTEL